MAAKKRKRKASPAQLAARAKFAAMARARAGKLRKKAAPKKRAANPVGHRRPPRVARGRQDYFQVAALRGSKVLYLSGLALTNNRGAASNFMSLTNAREAAGQVRKVGNQFNLSRVAVVARHDSDADIRGFLVGKA